jgi:hypothetical protein
MGKGLTLTVRREMMPAAREDAVLLCCRVYFNGLIWVLVKVQRESVGDNRNLVGLAGQRQHRFSSCFLAVLFVCREAKGNAGDVILESAKNVCKTGLFGSADMGQCRNE